MNFKFPEGTTKGEAAELLYGKQTLDCAVPQSFITACYARGFDDAAAHFVTLYPNKPDGKPDVPYIAPITERGVEIAARIATHLA